MREAYTLVTTVFEIVNETLVDPGAVDAMCDDGRMAQQGVISAFQELGQSSAGTVSR
jgi:hypothetical protein